MTLDIFTALALFAFVSSATPGPNNLMLMSSGANFGFRLTMPHMFGVSVGFTLMVLLVGIGIMQVFDMYPISYDILRVLSILYLLYLAWKIAGSSNSTEVSSKNSKPFTFTQAALFQWVNPKAWAMALMSISLYAPTKSLLSVALVAIIFGLVNLPCICSWVVLGQKLQRFLTEPKRLRSFNYTMAALLVLSVVPSFTSMT